MSYLDIISGMAQPQMDTGTAATLAGLVGDAPAAPVASPVQVAPVPEFARSVAPSTPEDFAQRKQGWQAFLQKLQTDPNMQRAALQAAAMLADRRPGQSAWGNITEAVAGGVQAHDAAVDKQKASDRQAKLDELAARHTEQQITSGLQGTAIHMAEEQRKQALAPAEKALHEAQAELAKAQAANSPEVARLQQKLMLAQIRAAQEKDHTSPQDNALQAQFNLIKRTSKGAGMTDAQIWDLVAEGQKQANRGTDVQVATALLNSLDPADQARGAELMRTLSAGIKGASEPPKGTPLKEGQEGTLNGRAVIVRGGKWVYK